MTHADPASPPLAEDAFTICAESWHGSDAAALRAELEAELRLRYGQGSSLEQGQSSDANPDLLPDSGHADPRVFLIARDRDRQPLGCGALGLVGHHTFQIRRMFVRPGARRHGVARALLAALEEEAVQAGARWIVLETGPMQPEAINLYVREGYAPILRPGARAGARRSMCFGRAAPRAALR